ncbi:MAG TPA: S49 family peptidase, partial [Candidatus Kapabacteria bacterium]|nr:S49 family peptidase [Candidatus Kapabacteria bacterium]
MAENEPRYQPPRYVPRARRRNSWVLPTVIILAVLAIILVPTILFFTTVGSFTKFTKTQKVEVKSNTVLTIELNEFNETSISNPFAMFGTKAKGSTFFETITSIKAAKDDPNIKGIVLKDGIGNYGFGKASDLLNALNEFKKSGKFVYSFFNYGNENTYYPALASDKIYVPSMGFFELNGFGVSAAFFKNLFDKIGIEYYVEQFEDYKSAGEQFTRTKFSDSAKKELRILVEQRYQNLIDTIAKYRNLDSKYVYDAVNRGVYSSDSLLALKFIDGVISEQDFKKEVYKKVFGKDLSDMSDLDDVNYIDIRNYAHREKSEEKTIVDEHKKIAIIKAAGSISSDFQNNPYQSNEGITDAKYIQYLEEARADKDVKAIILRIDSPGGSALASDNIWQKIREVRKEKPVYASMSDVAASGGYYIAMACDTIIAYPQTLT